MIFAKKFEMIASNDDVNETSLVASYYYLFRVDLTPRKDVESMELIEEEENNNGGFWAEDEWTAEDEAQAEALLEKSREKCSICNNNLALPLPLFKKGEEERAWDTFYAQHQTKFFKDRHYLHKAFPEEFSFGNSNLQPSNRKRTLVEIGCGVGNALLPLLDDEKCRWTVHGLDLSKVAVDLMHKDERFLNAAEDNRAFGYVCDISAFPESDSESGLTIPESCQGVADVATLLFCLSAIAPGQRMIQAVKNVAATLKPNKGVLVLRDYGRYDEAQMKLGTSRNKQMDDNFYRKHDGTKCFYFTLEDIRNLFKKAAGLKVLKLNYLRRIYRNRAKNEFRRRVWVQGRRFQKVN